MLLRSSFSLLVRLTIACAGSVTQAHFAWWDKWLPAGLEVDQHGLESREKKKVLLSPKLALIAWAWGSCIWSWEWGQPYLHCRDEDDGLGGGSNGTRGTIIGRRQNGSWA